MALVVADRVRETTTTTGTGTITLAGTITGYQSFSVIGNGNTTYYTINAGSQWEVGIGTYTAAGTLLSRDTVISSSNAGALVNFSAGTKDVFVGYPATKSISDGYGLLPVANGGTGATTLSSGYVLKGNGTSAVSASVIYDNGTNVGIGTASPAEKLTVQVNTGTSGLESGITLTNGVDANLFGYVTGTAATDKRALITAGAAAQSLTFGTLYTERMRIDASGNVGIGTAAPSGYGKLAVIGGNVGISQDGATVTTVRGNAGVSNMGAFASTGAALSFSTAPSGSGEVERMRIDSSGNVSIGTTSASAKLDVKSQVNVTSPSNVSMNAVRASNFGYSTSYNALILGSTSGNNTPCINVDPIANTSGSFGGLGDEVMFRNGAYFISPNSANTAYNQYLRLIDGYVQFTNSARSPIFYDSDNTAYYIDAASTSVLNIVTTAGYIQTYSGGVKWDESGVRSWSMYPSGGAMLLNSGDGNGSFNLGASGGVRAPIFYDSSNTAYYLNFADGGTSNVNTYITGLAFYKCVFGSGVYSGAVTSPPLQVYSEDGGTAMLSFHRTSAYAINMGLDPDNVLRIGGWSASANRWVLDGSGNNSVAGSFRAPIFYDSDNTGYFLDPNTTGNALRTAGYWLADTTAWAGDINGKIQYHDNSWYFSAANRWIFRASSGGEPFTVTQAGTAIALTDMRAPRFYDNDNTAYYIDAASTSNILGLTVANTISGFISGCTFSEDSVTKDDITTRTDSGFYQSPTGTTAEGWPINDSNWQHLISCTHSNDGNYFSMQLAASFFAQGLFYRSVNNSGTQAWSRVALYDNGYAAPLYASIYYDANDTAYYLNPNDTGTSLNVAGSIVAAGNVTAYSDIRIKANVETIPSALDKLDHIRGVTYTRTDLDDKERRYAGVIAQEIEAVLPEAVRDLGNIKAVDYNATIALLIQAVKELRDEVEALRK